MDRWWAGKVLGVIAQVCLIGKMIFRSCLKVGTSKVIVGWGSFAKLTTTQWLGGGAEVVRSTRAGGRCSDWHELRFGDGPTECCV